LPGHIKRLIFPDHHDLNCIKVIEIIFVVDRPDQIHTAELGVMTGTVRLPGLSFPGGSRAVALHHHDQFRIQTSNSLGNPVTGALMGVDVMITAAPKSEPPPKISSHVAKKLHRCWLKEHACRRSNIVRPSSFATGFRESGLSPCGRVSQQLFSLSRN
jgi:hypothetical protein